MADTRQNPCSTPEFPSGDLSLEEARRRYDEEERRRENIETKIRLALTANTIFISVGILILDGLQALAAVFPSIVSTIIGLGIILPKSYNSPIGEDQFYEYARAEPDEFYDDALLAYLVSINWNQVVNDLKMEILKATIYLSSSTLGLIFLSYWADLGTLGQFAIFSLPSIYSRLTYTLFEDLISTIKMM